MGGRNTSSGRTPPPAPTPPPMPIPPPTPKPKPKPKPQPAAIRLDTMDDASLSTFVSKAMNANLPAGFHDDITQRLIHLAKWNDKPEVLPASKAEAAAKKQGAVVLYRTVNYNPKLKMLSGKVADSLRTDDAFSTGGWSGQYYGGGVYFSDKLSGAKYYGNVRNGNAPTTIGAVLNGKAKVVDMDDLMGAKGLAWAKQHPAAARKLGLSVDKRRKNPLRSGKHQEGAYTAMAMAMGYNVVSSKVGAKEMYYTILDRSVLTTSTKDYYPSTRGMK